MFSDPLMYEQQSFNNNNNFGTGGGGGRFNRRDRKSRKSGYKFNHNSNNNRQKYSGDYDNSRGNDQRVTFSSNNNNNNGRWRDRVGLSKRPASIACAEWFKVVIPKARHCTREHLMDQISSIFGPPPMMYNFHWEQDNIVFWVTSADQQTFRAFNRRLYDSNRGQLRVNVSPDNNMPLPSDDVETRAKILQAMRSRYSVNDRYLNLSNFTHDPLLMAANLHVPLNKPFTLSMVLRLMVQNFPDIICLNFSQNNLESLKPFSQPNMKLEIKALDISQNKVS